MVEQEKLGVLQFRYLQTAETYGIGQESVMATFGQTVVVLYVATIAMSVPSTKTFGWTSIPKIIAA